MLRRRLILFTVLLLGLMPAGLQAQENINVTGGNASGSGGSVSYSVGQVFYTTSTGVNGSAAQGVQQPLEISVVTELEEAKGINLNLSAYPNPVTDILTLNVADFDATKLSYQLCDMSGKLLETKKLEGKQTSIVMTSLVPATYFLIVTASNKELKIFKIIKN